MILQKLRRIAFCLTVCFLFSCQESNNEESQSLSLKDSTLIESEDPEFLENETDTLESEKTEVVDETFSNLSEVTRRLRKRSSYFVIKNDRDTVIKCKEGTLLAIPANAFINTSNQKPVVGEVKIVVKEFYKLSDMVVQGLTTTSHNQLLESAGMININVIQKSNKDSCILKPGKNITIAMPSVETNNVEGMQLFNGVHDSTHLNWEPRAGIAGYAQSWNASRNNLLQPVFQLSSGFVFPNEVPKAKPLVINSHPEDLQAEVQLPLRDLMQTVGVATKKANAYIDTAGNLRCYQISGTRHLISFAKIYEPTSIQDLKVNLAVDVYLTYKSHLNHDYYQKLFKMGKGNPDSLVTITVTLKPTVKMTNLTKVKTYYRYALTVKEFQKKQKQRALVVKEYERRLEQLRLEDESRLTNLQSNSSTNLRSAQNYLLLSTPKLGWINCDKFSNTAEKVDYLVKLKEPASLLIVFNSIKSIIPSNSDGVFAGVPLHEKITLVGLKTENGKLMMAFHETSITEQPFEKLKFEPVTIKEYKAKLEKLNRM